MFTHENTLWQQCGFEILTPYRLFGEFLISFVQGIFCEDFLKHLSPSLLAKTDVIPEFGKVRDIEILVIQFEQAGRAKSFYLLVFWIELKWLLRYTREILSD
ncbi:hypothetical protein KIN20_002048 [Parelaphostrongylus tenuis]|uniref:Uncharacterized protein n=1 Tax=Parelaphostrongylus tenuis TaxID=148309 RepID=A0AAD5MG15_PARTN|nr:hypothetical protein KIN20_002048 [Parelaphostrongylus tenuis]